MFLGPVDTYDLGGCSGGGTNGVSSTELSVTVSTDTAGVRAPTFLILPADNGTVQTIPGGELEYTGERAFYLVVLDVPAGSRVESASFQPPWGGRNVTFTVGPGLNDFLVPRSMFLNSTLGRVLVEQQLVTKSGSVLETAALLGGAAQSAMEGYFGYTGGYQSVLNTLTCYSQDRAIPQSSYWTDLVNSESHSGSICPSEWVMDDPGTSEESPNLVNVSLDTSSAISDNAGGLPSDPALESAALAGGALQGAVTVNLTDSYSNYGQDLGLAPSLDLFLAGLLDNATGAVNGSIVNVSAYLNTLALPRGVINQLPNVTVLSLGAYGPPQRPSVSSSTKCPWFVCLWDAGGATWEWIINDAEHVDSSALNAAAAFFLSYRTWGEKFSLWFANLIVNPEVGLTELENAGSAIGGTLAGI